MPQPDVADVVQRRVVRRPRVDFNARGLIYTHGPQQVNYGVFHSTECSDAQGISELEAVVRFWREQKRGLGAHVIIDRDGNSALCANPGEIAYAVENHNTGAFHVELIGFARFTPKTWFLRRAQLDKLARWMAWLNLEFNVPLWLSCTHGWESHAAHSKLFGGTHTDPGRGFPKGYVLKLANKYRWEGWA